MEDQGRQLVRFEQNTMPRNAFDILEVATEAIEQRLRLNEVVSRYGSGSGKRQWVRFCALVCNECRKSSGNRAAADRDLR